MAQNAAWGTSTYLYDPLGQRKQKQVGEAITQFVLVGVQEIADYNGEGVGTPWMLTVRGVGGLAGGPHLQFASAPHLPQSADVGVCR